jgi:hypothetical protein
LTVSTRKKNIVERNIALLGRLIQYLLVNPQVFNSLPDNFELVILPEDDPQMRLYNLELLDAYGSEGKPVVLVRMKTSREIDFERARPSLYVPVAA